MGMKLQHRVLDGIVKICKLHGRKQAVPWHEVERLLEVQGESHPSATGRGCVSLPFQVRILMLRVKDGTHMAAMGHGPVQGILHRPPLEV